MPTPLQPGDAAPPFAGTTTDGATVSLADFAGRWLALYAYPKDDTPGCTRQACSLRDGWADLTAAGVSVLGVSPDDVPQHERFAEKYDLPFPLLADPDKTVLTAYGVYGDKTLYGRLTRGVTRTTFLISPDGTIAHVFRRPNVDDHASEILTRVRALTA